MNASEIPLDRVVGVARDVARGIKPVRSWGLVDQYPLLLKGRAVRAPFTFTPDPDPDAPDPGEVVCDLAALKTVAVDGPRLAFAPVPGLDNSDDVM